VYTTAGKALKLNDKQVEGLREISSASPDWAKIDQIRKELPRNFEVSKDKASERDRRETLGSTKEFIEKQREKGKEDLERATSGYFTRKEREELEKRREEKRALGRAKKSDPEDIATKREELKAIIGEKEEEKKRKQGKFSPVNPLIVRQSATDLKNYPGRYTWTVLSKNGKRFPFVIKRFNNMIQVSVNPDLDATQKEKINLYDDMKEVINRVKKVFMNRYNEWAFQVVDRESGGHKQITNISGLGTLGLMAKAKRDEMKAIQELEKRAEKVGKKLSEIMPKKAATLSDLEERKKMSAKFREVLMDEMEREFNKIIKDKYSGLEVKKPQEKTFDVAEAFRNNVSKILQS
jgi:hypothetical protein